MITDADQRTDVNHALARLGAAQLVETRLAGNLETAPPDMTDEAVAQLARRLGRALHRKTTALDYVRAVRAYYRQPSDATHTAMQHADQALQQLEAQAEQEARALLEDERTTQ